MRAHGVTLEQVFEAVRLSNLDVGARTIEINSVEYLVRGLGFIRSLEDLELAVVKSDAFVPIRIQDVARVSLGPALRTGALDKGGAEAVGGVAVVRHGFNPLEAIQNVKRQVQALAPALPIRPVIDWEQVPVEQVRTFAEDRGFTAFQPQSSQLAESAWLDWLRATPRAQWPDWVTTSQVTIVPFYDRTGLIQETLGTLNKALIEQALVTILVVVVMVLHLRGALLISSMLPIAVLMAFIAMNLFGVEANVVALAGIAIAIGTIVDMGIIVIENILKHLDEEPRQKAEGRRQKSEAQHPELPRADLSRDDRGGLRRPHRHRHYRHQFPPRLHHDRHGRQAVPAPRVHQDLRAHRLRLDRAVHHSRRRASPAHSPDRAYSVPTRALVWTGWPRHSGPDSCHRPWIDPGRPRRAAGAGNRGIPVGARPDSSRMGKGGTVVGQCRCGAVGHLDPDPGLAAARPRAGHVAQSRVRRDLRRRRAAALPRFSALLRQSAGLVPRSQGLVPGRWSPCWFCWALRPGLVSNGCSGSSHAGWP